MKNVGKGKSYHSPSVLIVGIDEQDVVRTSNGAEVDYQQQNWGRTFFDGNKE